MENEKTAPLEQGAEDEIAMNKAAYSAWKKDWERTGKTVDDAVLWCREHDMSEFADWLEGLILQMEASEQATNPQKECSQSRPNSRVVLDQERNDRADNCTEERVKKLESSIRLLTGFLIGKIVTELLLKIFFS